MEVLGIIPARFASSRFQGKVLADILGKPMLQWVYETAKKVRILDDVIIACDDERVEVAAQSFGAKVVFTSKEHTSGTDRIAEVANPIDTRIVVNIQADEPLVDASMIDNVARALLDNKTMVMSTLRKEIIDSKELYDPNVVKVTVNKDDFALYFSRSPIPCLFGRQACSEDDRQVCGEREIDKFNTSLDDKTRNESSAMTPKGFFKHIGLYAYTKDFLFTFKNLPVSLLEKIERLEQLRVLENGYKIRVIETSSETIGVDTPEDLEKVKEKLKTQQC